MSVARAQSEIDAREFVEWQLVIGGADLESDEAKLDRQAKSIEGWLSQFKR